MANQPAIRVRGLRKAYGATLAVAGVDLDVRRGEIFSLLGPNGAGKTTTVEILEGYRRRDAGEVAVLGVDPDRGDTAWRSEIGIVLQSTGEFEELTVSEVVSHFALYYPKAEDPQSVIDRVGLGDKRNARAKTLSGGQKRRLDVALGIIGRPVLLFLDEPTSGFDPEARREFWKLIKGLAGAGTTILLTTHYLDEAERLCDRLAIIDAGRIVACDTPAALLASVGDEILELRVADPDAAISALQDCGIAARDIVATGSTLTASLRQISSRLAVEHLARTAVEVASATTRRPTLDDVYLRLTGARIAGSDS